MNWRTDGNSFEVCEGDGVEGTVFTFHLLQFLSLKHLFCVSSRLVLVSLNDRGSKPRSWSLNLDRIIGLSE